MSEGVAQETRVGEIIPAVAKLKHMMQWPFIHARRLYPILPQFVLNVSNSIYIFDYNRESVKHRK